MRILATVLVTIGLFLAAPAIAQVPDDPCSPNPCENGGVCEEVSDGEASCICLPGYVGLACEYPDETCGNGIVNGDEQCDDGNLVSGDCCSESCQFESSGAACGDSGDTACDNSDSCDGSGVCLSNYEATTFDCGDSGTACTNQDKCDGAGSCADQGVVAEGTLCDDGDACTVADACAGAVCAGAPIDCDDANPCTEDSCEAGDGCVSTGAPVDAGTCYGAAKAKLKIGDAAEVGADKLSWKWIKGDAFEQPALGEPDVDTRYALCVYDMLADVPSLAASIVVEPSGLWTTRAPKGWSYKDTSGSSSGATKVAIKTSAVDGKTKIVFAAGGAGLLLPGSVGGDEYFHQDGSVLVQLLSEGGECWSSEFVAASSVNLETKFVGSQP
jgi:cysteine-rich repeat protein